MPRQERSPKWGGTDRNGITISLAGLIRAFRIWRGGGTLSPDLRFRNALSVLTGDQSDRFDIGKSAEDP